MEGYEWDFFPPNCILEEFEEKYVDQITQEFEKQCVG